MTLELARRDCASAVARLERIYGRVPPVVFVYQRAPDGDLGIAWGQRLVGRVQRLRAGDPRPVILRAVFPGSKAVDAWFRQRHAEGGTDIVADARRFGSLHATEFERSGDRGIATLVTIRAMDSLLADFERLRQNGATHRELAEMMGKTVNEVRTVVNRARAFGFDLPYSRTYHERLGQRRS